MITKTDRRSLRRINIPLKNCEVCFAVIPRNTRAGQNRIMPSQYLTARFCSKKCKGTQHSALMKGKNNPNYVHGHSSENEIARGSVKYKNWRQSVFRRDSWTCVFCAYKGKQIHADHIKPFAIFPELRFLVTNGRTLCKQCHEKTDSYRATYRKLEKLYGLQ